MRIAKYMSDKETELKYKERVVSILNEIRNNLFGFYSKHSISVTEVEDNYNKQG